jgi:hypothetical protein
MTIKATDADASPGRRLPMLAWLADRLVVDERADAAPRMIVGDERFQREVVEEPPLRIRLSNYEWPPPLTHATTSWQR